MEARDFVIDLQKWGLTQAQIAERSGVPQPTISKIARGSVDDVLSRNYRSLENVHREEATRRADEEANKQSKPGLAHGNAVTDRRTGIDRRQGPRRDAERRAPSTGDRPSNQKAS